MHIIIPKVYHVILDMDGVLADLYFQIYKLLKERHPHFILHDPNVQTEHYFSRQYPQYAKEIYEIFGEKGFFRNLPPVEGAIEAVHAIMKKHHVSLCTTPIENAKYCKPEKRAWKNEMLGTKVAIFFEKDKTRKRGDMIVDDNPKMEGKFLHTNPWEHVIYHQPYNKHVTDKRRIIWNNYHSVLPELA
ncbi:MAG: hypothetical protein AAB870_01415 [Patescibacteria group bacterium]